MDCESSLSDHDWYILKINQSKTLDRLDYLAENIKYDTWEKAEYTKDQDAMNRIRQAWSKKKKELSKP